jgi:hypothetical protein
MTFLYDTVEKLPTLEAKKDKLQIVYLTLKFDILLETSLHHLHHSSQATNFKKSTKIQIVHEELKNKATLVYYDIKENYNRMCQRYSPRKFQRYSRDILFSPIIHQNFLKIVQEGPKILKDCF